MDRGERRRRDENYVRWMKRYRAYQYWWQPRWLKWNLGAKKWRLYMHSRCSKKTPGRPKVGRGCKHAPESSPKIARYKLKEKLRKWDLDNCAR
jgi:hypothetical protein